MTIEQDERRGEDARQVLDSPVYKEAYAQIEANIVNKLALQGTGNDEANDLRRLLIALRRVRGYMEQVATTGTMAAMELERKRTLRERAQDAMR